MLNMVVVVSLSLKIWRKLRFEKDIFRSFAKIYETLCTKLLETDEIRKNKKEDRNRRLIGIGSNAYPKGRLGMCLPKIWDIGGRCGGRKLLPITP